MTERPGIGAALWAAALSLIAPGLGQVYARRFRAGAGLWAASLVLWLAMSVLTWMTAPTGGSLLGLIAVAMVLNLGAAVAAFRQKRAQVATGRPRWFMSTWFAAGALVVFWMAAAAVAPGYGWRSFSIPSASNAPTLRVGDLVMADARRPGTMPEPGEMVVFRMPKDERVEYVKRAVAVAGDRVRMVEGVPVVNGTPARREALGTLTLDGDGPAMTARRSRETLANGRSYEILKLGAGGRMDDTPEYTVPAGHFFVLGDHRDNSLDSRMMDAMGFVPARNVVGPVRLIVWAEDWRRILAPVQ